MHEPLNLCFIHGRADLIEHLRTLGHAILNLRPEEIVFDLPAALETAGFVPDAIIQTERLGSRTLLRGLPRLSCPKTFWSVDTHMNLDWHGHYGKLFDLVLTTQKAWIPRLQRAGIARVEWLPWFGVRRPFTPHPRRSRDIAFVGRVTEHRPGRMWFAQFLRRNYGVEPVEGLTFGQMMDWYADSRMVPNETIFGEVNFRLFEAASCGCAVFNPNISEELTELFEPSVEIELFEHVFDLKFLIDRYRADPLAGMRLGLAAWERVQREHLPEHRAGRLLERTLASGGSAATGEGARKAFTLACFALWEGGRMDMSSDRVLEMLTSLGDDSEVLAARLRALAFLDQREALSELLGTLLRKPKAGNLRLDCLCSLAALRLKEWDLAKLFWYRYVESLKNRVAPKPDNAAQLCRLWAREQQRLGDLMRAGFLFREDRHLPMTALECLLTGLQADIEDLRTYQRLSQAVADVTGAEPGRMGFLSHLALHDPANWRLSLELALTHLRAFRLDEGLSELFSARDIAARAGEQDRLVRILAARDPGGLLISALEDAE
ncbi:MAG: glycosyltransferase [Proteobacteria bacterium]|nr:glycosyltransferase [Pseudomonadota bacterium]MBU1610404.1 glycosyltransferase [Pseudomonadota bacterium]